MILVGVAISLWLLSRSLDEVSSNTMLNSEIVHSISAAKVPAYLEAVFILSLQDTSTIKTTRVFVLDTTITSLTCD